MVFQREALPITSDVCRVQTPSAMPVRLLKQSVWRWQAPDQALDSSSRALRELLGRLAYRTW